MKMKYHSGMLWPEELGADCANCPLNFQTPVPNEPVSGDHRLTIVGESPGRVEEKKGRPFVGRSGAELNNILKRFKIKREDVHITNALLCRPLKNTPAKDLNKALECCAPRLSIELIPLKDKLVITMGAHALKAMTGKTNILPWRGFPLHTKGYVIFPTIHPSFVLRSPSYLPVWINDISRAIALSKKSSLEISYSFEEPLIVDEGPDMVKGLCQLLESSSVAIDVETAGTDAFTAPILCIGIANEDIAVSVPWPAPTTQLEYLVRAIITNAKIQKVFQNRNYDVITLEENGLPVQGDFFDTLDAHAIVAPQLPHDLGFIASSYFMYPRWKTEFRVFDDKKGSDAFARASARELRVYNSKDALMTAKLRAPLLMELERTKNGMEIYNQTMKLGDLARNMMRTGIEINKPELEKQNKQLKIQMEEAQKKFREEIDAPEFNLNSPKQLKELFFGKFQCKVSFLSKITGAASLNKNAIEKIIATGPEVAKRPAQYLYQYRIAKKLHSTYIVGIQERMYGYTDAMESGTESDGALG